MKYRALDGDVAHVRIPAEGCGEGGLESGMAAAFLNPVKTVGLDLFGMAEIAGGLRAVAGSSRAVGEVGPGPAGLVLAHRADPQQEASTAAGAGEGGLAAIPIGGDPQTQVADPTGVERIQKRIGLDQGGGGGAMVADEGDAAGGTVGIRVVGEGEVSLLRSGMKTGERL